MRRRRCPSSSSASGSSWLGGHGHWPASPARRCCASPTRTPPMCSLASSSKSATVAPPATASRSGTFDDLIDFLTGRVSQDSPNFDPAWTAGVQAGTCSAFLRRLYAQGPRLGHLICCGVTPVELRRSITVVDIHALHDAAQRFVVGSLTSRIFEEKQGSGREPLRFIVLDELNKYAPRTGRSPIKEVLVDIAARGRSLGVLLIGAQQSAGDVDANITRNAAIKVAWPP